MVNIKKQLDSLLTKEMDRKNFLQYSGGILLAVIGVSGLIRLLVTTHHAPVAEPASQKNNGYGASKYGQ